jgi:hypothetical protein
VTQLAIESEAELRTDGVGIKKLWAGRTQPAKGIEAELRIEGLGIRKEWLGRTNLPTSSKHSYSERCSVSWSIEWAVTQIANESEAELHREVLGIQKERLGNDLSCQRERSRATQVGDRYPEGVTG